VTDQAGLFEFAHGGTIFSVFHPYPPTKEISPESAMSACGKAANMGAFSSVSNEIPGELSEVCCGCSLKSALKRSKTASNISATGHSLQ
jgi:hypothetical protein